MADSRSLQSTIPEATRTRLSTLEAEVADRERELASVKAGLLQLQQDYFREVGALHAERDDLEASVADLEVRLGLRPTPDEIEDADRGGEADAPAAEEGCGNRGAVSPNLKRVFRDIAKAIHPDRALRMGDPEHFQRHSLMAEANRAYAERDEDRLLLILRTWERSPESVIDDGPAGDRERAERRVAQLDERLVAIEAEIAELRTTAIWRLKTKIDDARAQGWDLYAEILAEVKRQIARARSRLAALHRLDPTARVAPIYPSSRGSS